MPTDSARSQNWQCRGRYKRQTHWQSGWTSLHLDQSVTHLPHPPFLRRMPFLLQPSQFILAWNRHQICWLAYPVAWLHNIQIHTVYISFVASSPSCSDCWLPGQLSGRGFSETGDKSILVRGGLTGTTTSPWMMNCYHSQTERRVKRSTF